jgi:DNA-binding transcriptional regulator LsrR (DeoR family)
MSRGAKFDPKKLPHPTWYRCFLLSQQGKSRKEIAAELGISVSKVSFFAQYARKRHGLQIAPFESKDRSFVMNLVRNKKTGSVGKLLYGLPRPVATWLVSQIPADATLADVVRAIVVDAYDEETTSPATRGSSTPTPP